MVSVWLVIAVIFGIIWFGISLSQKIKGDKHQSEAREFAATGNWQQASLSYKLAILQRLDSNDKMRELVRELTDLYKKYGHNVDLNRLLECPDILKNLGAGTGSQKKKNELILKLYAQTGDFLDKLPGPPLPEK